jgi:sugar fermentation stimulation protein A
MEGIKDVSPNDQTHPQFGEAIARAREAGVTILAYDCLVTPDTLTVNKEINFI